MGWGGYLMTSNILYIQIGDSITVDPSYSSGTPNPALTYANLTRNYLRSKMNITYVNRSGSGSTTANAVSNLHWNTNFEADLAIISLGMNDSQYSLTVSNYVGNIQIIINRLKSRNPSINIILCTPSNTNDSVRLANIASFRTALATLAVTNNCYCCHLENAWNTSLNSTYLKLESDGVTMLHPNTLGHQLLFGVLQPILDTIYT